VIKISDGIYKEFDVRYEDVPMMVLDDLSEMFGLSQMDYLFMNAAVSSPVGIRARDSQGRTIK